MTLIQLHKDHSPKEEWGEPNIGKVQPLDQMKVEYVVENIKFFQEWDGLETKLFVPPRW